jgi:hypothetical protein
VPKRASGYQPGRINERLYFDISMSLDGFVTGPGEGVGNPLGEGGERLHDWMFAAKNRR